jgi:hypothetical protein
MTLAQRASAARKKADAVSGVTLMIKSNISANAVQTPGTDTKLQADPAALRRLRSLQVAAPASEGGDIGC